MGDGITAADYPDAPYNLTDAEADEWRGIVSSMQPGYFARSHYPLLAQLCRHIVASNRLAQLIEATCKIKKVNKYELTSLLKAQNSESASIVRLCRQMRLAHKSLYRAESTKQRPMKTIDAPWVRE